MEKKARILIIVSCLLASVCSASEPGSVTELYNGFVNPEKQYRPRVWWHWMHGNVTREGIRKDLEWMDRVGIAGFHQFNCQLNPTDVIVGRRVELFSNEWNEMFSYALDVADSLGLEVSIAASPGWSLTGGPWVSEEQAQKKIVWRRMDLRGGRRIRQALPETYEFSGPFQDVPLYPDDVYKFRYYKDIAVLAVRTDGMTAADTVAKWQNKTGFYPDWRVNAHTPPTKAANAAKEVLDISDKVKDGILDWKAPRGNWTVFRFGYNLLGKQNGPVERAGKGLEADKLSREAMLKYYTDYLSIFDKASHHRLGTTIKYLMIDSYEAGKGTWTPDLPREFKARRGYDLIPWLPVLAGVPVGSAEESDNFLHDWRLTLGELLAENHYDLAAWLLKQYGMGLHAESHEQASAFTGDGMIAKRNADVPMGAIWVNFNNGWYADNPSAAADIKESSSVAHIYGGNVCAAESFSVNSRPTVEGHFPAYQCCPDNLKPLADAALSHGLNRFIMHCSPHQPLDDKFPGLGLGSFGNWFTRHDTWAEEAKPWHDYLTRSCYLLQQGRNVAEVAYLYGEDWNVTALFREDRVPVSQGYAYDFVNSDILQNVLSVKNGELSSPGGARYRALVLGRGTEIMSAGLKQRIKELEASGVAVIKGSTAQELKQGLVAAGIKPDFTVVHAPERADIRFVHRSLPDADIYWIGNISPAKGELSFTLRTGTGAVSIWDAETGLRRPVAVSTDSKGLSCSLELCGNDARFIVIDHLAAPETVPEMRPTGSWKRIDGPWKVAFQENRGAPESITLQILQDLSLNSCEAVRHFSGTMRYSTEFEADARSVHRLDLGEVHCMARVLLNGRDIGLLWHKPYVCDISDAVVCGTNKLEVIVINLWANRLIGDSALPLKERIAYTPFKFYTADVPLPPSGLVGPVRLFSGESKKMY